MAQEISPPIAQASLQGIENDIEIPMTQLSGPAIQITSKNSRQYHLPHQLVSPKPLTLLVVAKPTSAGFAFVAGSDGGSVGALIPYILRSYNAQTGSLAILYASGFAGWIVAALAGGYARVYIGTGGALVLGARCN